MTRELGIATALLVLATSALAGVNGRQAPPRPDAETHAPTTSVRSNYVVHCAGCHGMDGSGSALGRVPDMRRLGQFLQIDGGRDFVIKVPGVMGSGLDDRQVADVTNWVLTTLAKASVPADHIPYDESEVRRARSTPLVDVAAARLKLVEQARAQGVSID